MPTSPAAPGRPSPLRPSERHPSKGGTTWPKRPRRRPRTETPTQDDTVSADRFREVAKHKKAAEDRAKALEKQIADLQAAIEDRDTQGLPELDKLRKNLEQAQKRAEDAEKRATDNERAAESPQGVVGDAVGPGSGFMTLRTP
jgi:TolA-binding protein